MTLLSSELAAPFVEAEEDGPEPGPLDDAEARRGRDAVERLRRHRLDHVEPARDQAGHQRLRIGDGREDHPVEIVLGPVPPARIGHQLGALAGNARLEHEGSGAVGMVVGIARVAAREIGWSLRVMRLAPGAAHDRPYG